jgi:hypothetical protein
MFKFDGRGNLKKPFFRKTAFGNQDMTMRVKSQEISESLNGYGGPGDEIFPGNTMLLTVEVLSLPSSSQRPAKQS